MDANFWKIGHFARARAPRATRDWYMEVRGVQQQRPHTHAHTRSHVTESELAAGQKKKKNEQAGEKEPGAARGRELHPANSICPGVEKNYLIPRSRPGVASLSEMDGLPTPAARARVRPLFFCGSRAILVCRVLSARACESRCMNLYTCSVADYIFTFVVKQRSAGESAEQ